MMIGHRSGMDNRGHSRSGMDNRGNSMSNGSHSMNSISRVSVVGMSQSSKVVGTSSSHCGFINRGDGAIGVSLESKEALGIRVGSSIGTIGIRVGSSVGTMGISNSMSNSMGSQVISPGGSHSGFIYGSHGPIWVSLESKEPLGRGNSQTGSKNQKLHV
jgi:hypothetical protein